MLLRVSPIRRHRLSVLCDRSGRAQGVGPQRGLNFKRSAEYLFLAPTIDADKALEWGMVNKVVPRAELEDTVEEMARTIATERDYAADVARARRFAFLAADGVVENLVEAAIRFVISTPEVSTALVGMSSLGQLEHAVACANRGPLPDEVISRLHTV